MGYVFPCHRCGILIRISEPKLETKYRCPKCRAKVKYVASRRATMDSHEAVEVGPSSGMVRIAIAALVVAILAAGGISYYGYRTTRIKAAELARLQQLSLVQITEARKKAKAYSFQEVGGVLSKAESEIKQSTILDPQYRDTLLDRLVMVRSELNLAQKDYEGKLKEGFAIVDGRLVSPNQLAQALEEKRRNEDAARARQEAERQAREEAAEKERAIQEAEHRSIEEKERQLREQESAQGHLKESLRLLPPIEDVLNSFEFTLQRAKMTSVLLSQRLSEVDPNKPFDVKEFTVSQEEVMRRLEEPNAPLPPLVTALHDEIVGHLRNLNFKAFLKSGSAGKPEGLPVALAAHVGQPALLLGTVYTDVQFDDSVLGAGTIEQRAAEFVRRTVVPAISLRPLAGSVKTTRLKYLAIALAYGNKATAKSNQAAEAEFLCVVLPMKELLAVGPKRLPPEELLKRSFFYIAARDEKVRQVELTLE